MAQGDGNPGVNKLAQAIDDHVKQYSDDITGELKIDYGVINSDYSLSTNTFSHPIATGDYMVCRSLTWGETDSEITETKEEVIGGDVPKHKHKVKLPEKMRWLKPGDRVIVGWVQNDVCVLDIILSSDVLG